MLSSRQNLINDQDRLCQAIQRGDKEAAERLLLNADVNYRYKEGYTLLHWAVFWLQDSNITRECISFHCTVIKSNSLSIIKMLLDNGADTHAVDHSNHSPLMVAILNNKMEAASLLIKRGALIGEDLNSLLLMAISRFNHIIVKELVDYGMPANPLTDLRTSLNAAISLGYLQIIEHIIPHCQYLEPSNKYIPEKLLLKSDIRYKDCVKFLLKWDFTINLESYHNKNIISATVENGYLPIFSKLLTFGIDVNMVNPNTGLNLLMIACLNKQYEIVEKLLENNADVNAAISAHYFNAYYSWSSNSIHAFNYLFPSGHKNCLSNITCLHIAAFNSDSKIIKMLLKYGAKITDNQNFFHLICIAAQNGCEEIVRIFLNYDIDVNNIVYEGITHLHFCVHSKRDRKNGSYNIAKLFLEKGAQIHLQTPGNTLVFDAIKNNNNKMARLFLDYNANVQYISLHGDTLLHTAIHSDFDAEFIKRLLNAHVPADALNTYGLTAFHLACRIKSKNQIENIKVFLQHNANINCTDTALMTPLHHAYLARNLKAAKILLEKGANPNATDKMGQTPLHFVCHHKHDMTASLIQLLLQYNANIEAVDKMGNTPLYVACHWYNDVAVKYLLKNYANVNYTNFRNFTPIFCAIDNNSIEFTESLIKYGANINIMSKDNQTPLQYINDIRTYRDVSFNFEINEMNLMNRYEITKILKRQIIKLKVAGLHVNIQDFNLANDSAIDTQALKIKCQQEIEKMKVERICNGKITFYDLLKKGIHALTRLVKNEEVQKLLKLELYNEKFPLYIDIIRSRMREAGVRYRIMDFSTEYFSIIAYHHLPYECVENVLDYLDIKELNRFNRIRKLLNE